MRLPKLDLRRFDGELTDGTAFWDLYESAIHNSTDLSAIDKFTYLRSLLEGPAAIAIAGLTLSSPNYAEAITILKKRFGNKQAIVSRHMDTLMSLEAVASQNNYKGLRQLYNLMESHVRGLHALGIPSSSFGTLLASVFMNKLPPELRLTGSREVVGDKWELDAVMKIVEKEIDARERAAASLCMGGKRQQRATYGSCTPDAFN